MNKPVNIIARCAMAALAIATIAAVAAYAHQLNAGDKVSLIIRPDGNPKPATVVAGGFILDDGRMIMARPVAGASQNRYSTMYGVISGSGKVIDVVNILTDGAPRPGMPAMLMDRDNGGMEPVVLTDAGYVNRAGRTISTRRVVEPCPVTAYRSYDGRELSAYSCSLTGDINIDD
ncbi:MAG: hypothetical protein WC421_00155 [Elusimicrobiales bacterium]